MEPVCRHYLDSLSSISAAGHSSNTHCRFDRSSLMAAQMQFVAWLAPTHGRVADKGASAGEPLGGVKTGAMKSSDTRQAIVDTIVQEHDVSDRRQAH